MRRAMRCASDTPLMSYLQVHLPLKMKVHSVSLKKLQGCSQTDQLFGPFQKLPKSATSSHASNVLSNLMLMKSSLSLNNKTFTFVKTFQRRNWQSTVTNVFISSKYDNLLILKWHEFNNLVISLSRSRNI